MAPYYDSDLGSVNVNELEFFKIAQDTVDDSGVWANEHMINNNNMTWTATIPADIRPGRYIIRHEIAALHFSVTSSPGFEFLPIAAQFYMTCFNFNISGSGDALPPMNLRVKFPGAYRDDDPGMRFDVRNTTTNREKKYIPLGPPVYKSGYTVNLPPKEMTVVSPTGGGPDADAAYFTAQQAFLERQGAITAYFDSVGG